MCTAQLGKTRRSVVLKPTSKRTMSSQWSVSTVFPHANFRICGQNSRTSLRYKWPVIPSFTAHLEQSGESTLKLFENVEGQTALVFTNLNPFKLFKLLENSKTPAPAKAGEKAPRDIIVEKGPTSFRPGPIVGDLQNAGIPAAIEKGKIVIRETKTVAKTGESISARLADVLQRLEIYPMEVGLYLRAAYDGDVIYTSEDLKIDEQAYFNQFVSAVSSALNLSINIGYPTSLTIETLLQKGTF